jgi:imidazolonepropionase-like amidohydrolase
VRTISTVELIGIVYARWMLIRLPYADPYEIGVSGSVFAEPDGATANLPDTSDLWALPGLADCHSHVSMTSLSNFEAITTESMAAAIPANTWAHLEHGVVLILDKGGKTDSTLMMLDHDADVRPHIEAAGSMIHPVGGYYDGFGAEVEADSLIEYIHTTAALQGGWLKLVGDWPRRGQGPINNWPPKVLEEAVRVSHAAGARVAVHSMAHSASEAVAAGVDSIEHGPFLTDEDLKALADRGGAWVPTIVNMLHLRDMLGVDSSGGRMFQEGLDRMRTLLPQAEQLGVIVLAGTDMAVPPGEVATEALRLRDYGLSDREAAKATTTNAFTYVGRPDRPAVGAEADVVFFEGNPFDDVGVLAEPRLVIRRGKVVRNSRV